MNILMVEPTGRNSHYHYVRALFDRLTSKGCALTVLTASSYNHPGYLNHLHRLTERNPFRWRFIGGVIRKIDRFHKISVNYLRILKTIRHTNAHIVHFQVLHHLYLPLLWIAKKKLHFQVTYTPHNIGGHYRNKWLLNSLNSFFFKRCHRVIDTFIAHTAYHRDKLRELGIENDKITIIPYAPHMVGTVDRSLRMKHSILFAGSIRRNKGIEHFLQSLQILNRMWRQSHTEPVRVMIAGQSRDVTINEAINNLKLECEHLDITFANTFIPPVQYAEYFNRALILVLPYTREFQSLSAVLLDGYHYDNEIIATDAGANGQTVKRDGAGIVVDPGDKEAMAHHIYHILSEGPNPLHSRNRAKALQEIYNWDKIADNTLEFYKKMLHPKEQPFDEND
jgi:glycosyltransferase involved in cell wall biosynthesis